MRNTAQIVASFVMMLAVQVSFSQGGQAASATAPTGESVISYPTVQEALDALKAKPNVRIETTKPDAWTIVSEPGDVQWSFTPASHYAYPAVVRRAIKQDAQGNLSIEMTSLCQASKPSCDQLIEEFVALNERTRQKVKARLQN